MQILWQGAQAAINSGTGQAALVFMILAIVFLTTTVIRHLTDILRVGAYTLAVIAIVGATLYYFGLPITPTADALLKEGDRLLAENPRRFLAASPDDRGAIWQWITAERFQIRQALRRANNEPKGDKPIRAMAEALQKKSLISKNLECGIKVFAFSTYFTEWPGGCTVKPNENELTWTVKNAENIRKAIEDITTGEKATFLPEDTVCTWAEAEQESFDKKTSECK